MFEKQINNIIKYTNYDIKEESTDKYNIAIVGFSSWSIDEEKLRFEFRQVGFSDGDSPEEQIKYIKGSKNECFHFFATNNFELTGALIVVGLSKKDRFILKCALYSFFRILGAFGTVKTNASILTLENTWPIITNMDLEALKLLYDPKILLGDTRINAMRKAREILHQE